MSGYVSLSMLIQPPAPAQWRKLTHIRQRETHTRADARSAVANRKENANGEGGRKARREATAMIERGGERHRGQWQPPLLFLPHMPHPSYGTG